MTLRAVASALAALVLVVAALSGCVARAVPDGQCAFNDDCESPLVCFNRRCRAACSTDRDCITAGAGYRCARGDEPGQRVCVPPEEPRRCVYHSECDVDAGSVCAHDGVCRPQCRTDADCRAFAPGSVCVREGIDAGSGAGVCRRPEVDAGGVVDAEDAQQPADAGCPDGATACGATCADLQRDPRRCGACDNDCTRLANVNPAAVRCTGGACNLMMGACLPGFAHCGSDPAAGCETDLSRPESCGACDRRCDAAAPLCAPAPADAGSNAPFACVARCPAGSTECGARCVDVATDPEHCGACGRACPVAPHTTARCAAGACAFACEAGWADCDGSAVNGCETDTRSDDAHCGACARRCALPNATAACVAGACALALCDPGFADCDAAAANGCETDTRTSAAHCGACGAACAIPNASAACAAGACVRRGCDPGFGDCDGDPANGCETDTRANPAHCGACGASCRLPNASGSCVAGACAPGACDPGFGDCDRDPANGCETDTRGDPDHCGACGASCARPDGVYACAFGRCELRGCAPGRGDCDANPANGCEADVLTSTVHCGGCGRMCFVPNAVPSCSAGACGVAACNPGFADCDRVAPNGCEANVAMDPMHCGACGATCAPPNASGFCATGTCRPGMCFPGFGDCDGNLANGCETNLDTDAANCGTCGARCAAINGTAVCRARMCDVACDAGFGNCDANPMNGCEADLGASVMHCGGCGRMCAAPPNTTARCAAGACEVTPNAGYTCEMMFCYPTPPRHVAPLSGHRVTLRRPTFRWRLAPGTMSAQVDVCSDPGCGAPVLTQRVFGESFTPPTDLAPGRYFWRLRPYVGMDFGMRTTAPWTFVVPHGTRVGRDASWGTGPDVDGDGATDALGGSTDRGGGAYWFRGQRTGGGGGGGDGISRVPEPFLSGAENVAGLGDVNGDGYADVGLADQDGLRVYFGGPGRIVAPPSQLVATPGGAADFGSGIATAGDVNGDGFNDVIVGAGGSRTAYVFHGSATGLGAAPATTLTGGPGFGERVALAGDVNADGFSDVIVGACSADGMTRCGEAAAVFLGGIGGIGAMPAATLTGAPGSGFGAAVAGGSDVNADGFDDVAVTAIGAEQVLVFHGQAGGVATTASTTINAPMPVGRFGAAIAMPGDLDRDGYDDLAVGSPNERRVHAFRGGGAGLETMGSLSPPGMMPTNYGKALLGAGDVNADGFPDLVVGGAGTDLVEVLTWNGGFMNLRSLGVGIAPGTSPTVALRRAPARRSPLRGVI